MEFQCRASPIYDDRVKHWKILFKKIKGIGLQVLTNGWRTSSFFFYKHLRSIVISLHKRKPFLYYDFAPAPVQIFWDKCPSTFFYCSNKAKNQDFNKILAVTTETAQIHSMFQLICNWSTLSADSTVRALLWRIKSCPERGFESPRHIVPAPPPGDSSQGRRFSGAPEYFL